MSLPYAAGIFFIMWLCVSQAALERDIQDTLQSWKGRLQAAALIFVHAPSSNAAALFGGDHPVLDRSDVRIRSVPFTTRRPTFTETKRVLTTLLSVQSAELPPTPAAGLSHGPGISQALRLMVLLSVLLTGVSVLQQPLRQPRNRREYTKALKSRKTQKRQSSSLQLPQPFPNHLCILLRRQATLTR